jgi:hypothetical protein
MTDYQLDQILRAAKRLASAARFEGIALTGKASEDYRRRQQVTAAAWTALRAAVEPTSSSGPDAQPIPRPRPSLAPGHLPQNPPRQAPEPVGSGTATSGWDLSP